MGKPKCKTCKDTKVIPVIGGRTDPAEKPCPDCMEENLRTCNLCENRFPEEEMKKHGGRWHCEDCYIHLNLP